MLLLRRTLRSNLHQPLPLPPFSHPNSVSRVSKSAPQFPTDPNPKTLSSLFFSKPSRFSKSEKPLPPKDFPKKAETRGNSRRYPPLEEKEFPGELSPLLAELIRRLIQDGYMKEANFSKGGEVQLEPQQVPANMYSRHFIKAAAERFGLDHQEIGKWLSGSDLKKLALFGCPSIERKTVFAAKRLRSFFKIQEDITCRACQLRSSCKFVNQRVGTVEKVILADVMRLITLLTLDSIPQQLSVPDDFKISINKLLEEVIKLSN